MVAKQILFKPLILINWVNLLLAYISLLINYKMFEFFIKVFFKIKFLYDIKWQMRCKNSEYNLKYFFKIKNKQLRKRLAYQHIFQLFYNHTQLFDTAYIYLMGEAGYLSQARNMRFIAQEDIQKIVNQNKKVIFCHSHSNSKIFSIIALTKQFSVGKTTLYIQKNFNQAIVNLITQASHNENFEVNTYDSGIGDERAFLSSIKQHDIIHLFFDPSIFRIQSEYKTCKIKLFDQEGIVISTPAMLSRLIKAPLVPVFCSGKNIFLSKPIAYDEFQGTKDEKITQTMQALYDSNMAHIKEFSYSWDYTHQCEHYFRDTKYEA